MSSYAFTTYARRNEPIRRTVSNAPATEAQLKFLETLLMDRDFSAEVAAAFRVRCSVRVSDQDLTKKEASDAIGWIKDHCPVKAKTARIAGADGSYLATRIPAVPEGYYALIGQDETVRFYRVDAPTSGKWAGRTFVKVQASDELHPVRGEAAEAILRRIAEAPEAASARYGRHIGRCGVCSRTLTKEESRVRGIGPVCAGKNGW